MMRLIERPINILMLERCAQLLTAQCYRSIGVTTEYTRTISYIRDRIEYSEMGWRKNKQDSSRLMGD